MMRVLVLQQPSSRSPVDRWLKEVEPAADILLLTGEGAKRSADQLHPETHVVHLRDYYAASADAEIIRLCAEFEPDRVVSNSESDVMRAAEARTLLGIPGQSSASAIMFRDKVRMKTLFNDAGIESVPYREASCTEDLLSALDHWGIMVVKPRDGSGSEDVHVIESIDDLRRECIRRPSFLRSLHEGRLMAEQYVEGTLFHIDVGLAGRHIGLVSISRYVALPHTFRDADIASVMVDEEDVDFSALKAIAERLVSSLPPEHCVPVMHLEVFKTPEGTYLAGEVASRLGGALIKDGIKHSFGIDLSWVSSVAGAGLYETWRQESRVGAQTGWLLWTASEPPCLDDSVLPGWVLNFYNRERKEGPTYSGDARALCLIEGDNHDQIVERMALLRGTAAAPA